MDILFDRENVDLPMTSASGRDVGLPIASVSTFKELEQQSEGFTDLEFKQQDPVDIKPKMNISFERRMSTIEEATEDIPSPRSLVNIDKEFRYALKSFGREKTLKSLGRGNLLENHEENEENILRDRIADKGLWLRSSDERFGIENELKTLENDDSRFETLNLRSDAFPGKNVLDIENFSPALDNRDGEENIPNENKMMNQDNHDIELKKEDDFRLNIFMEDFLCEPVECLSCDGNTTTQRTGQLKDFSDPITSLNRDENDFALNDGLFHIDLDAYGVPCDRRKSLELRLDGLRDFINRILKERRSLEEDRILLTETLEIVNRQAKAVCGLDEEAVRAWNERPANDRRAENVSSEDESSEEIRKKSMKHSTSRSVLQEESRSNGLSTTMEDTKTARGKSLYKEVKFNNLGDNEMDDTVHLEGKTYSDRERNVTVLQEKSGSNGLAFLNENFEEANGQNSLNSGKDMDSCLNKDKSFSESHLDEKVECSTDIGDIEDCHRICDGAQNSEAAKSQELEDHYDPNVEIVPDFVDGCRVGAQNTEPTQIQDLRYAKDSSSTENTKLTKKQDLNLFAVGSGTRDTKTTKILGNAFVTNTQDLTYSAFEYEELVVNLEEALLENIDLKNENTKLSAINEDLQQRIEHLLTDGEEMQFRMNEATLKLMEESQRQRDENSVLKSNFNRVLKDYNTLEYELKEFEGKYEDLLSEREILLTKLSIKNESYYVCKENCEKLSKELEEVREKIDSCSTKQDKIWSRSDWEEWTVLQSKFASTEKALSDSRKQRSQLVSDLKVMKSRLEESKDRITDAENAMRGLEWNLKRAEENNQLLHSENEELRNSLLKYELNLLELNRLYNENTERNRQLVADVTEAKLNEEVMKQAASEPCEVCKCPVKNSAVLEGGLLDELELNRELMKLPLNGGIESELVDWDNQPASEQCEISVCRKSADVERGLHTVVKRTMELNKPVGNDRCTHCVDLENALLVEARRDEKLKLNDNSQCDLEGDLHNEEFKKQLDSQRKICKNCAGGDEGHDIDLASRSTESADTNLSKESRNQDNQRKMCTRCFQESSDIGGDLVAWANKVTDEMLNRPWTGHCKICKEQIDLHSPESLGDCQACATVDSQVKNKDKGDVVILRQASKRPSVRRAMTFPTAEMELSGDYSRDEGCHADVFADGQYQNAFQEIGVNKPCNKVATIVTEIECLAGEDARDLPVPGEKGKGARRLKLGGKGNSKNCFPFRMLLPSVVHGMLHSKSKKATDLDRGLSLDDASVGPRPTGYQVSTESEVSCSGPFSSEKEGPFHTKETEAQREAVKELAM